MWDERRIEKDSRREEGNGGEYENIHRDNMGVWTDKKWMEWSNNFYLFLIYNRILCINNCLFINKNKKK